MGKEVSETAEKLRKAEATFANAIVNCRATINVSVALQDYGDALLAHHLAVEADKARQRKEVEKCGFGQRS